MILQIERGRAGRRAALAIDVPLSIAVAVLLEYQVDSICTPGAKRSTHAPKFANDALLSIIFVALTVIALETRAGEIVQASVGDAVVRRPVSGDDTDRDSVSDGGVDGGVETRSTANRYRSRCSSPPAGRFDDRSMAQSIPFTMSLTNPRF